jgi:Kae1-associated kinase Bud32
MIGKTISHYRITEKLGQGGMGEVFLAEDTDLNRNVAIKFLPQHLTKDKENVERFKREAQATASLNHPNIVTIHEISHDDDQIFIVMEYVEGKSLRDIINEYKLGLEKIIDIITQICEGLSKAHRAGIVHRDIKPENIIIDQDGRVKLLDFGLAKLKGVSKLTKESSTIGTAYYMAPEQIQGKEIDHKADIWSLGVVIFELLTGQPPFKGEYESSVHYAILNEEPDLERSGISKGMKNLVGKCLSKNPVDRFDTINGLVTELHSDYGKSSDVDANKISKTRRITYISLIAIAFIIVIFTIDYFTNPSNKSDKSSKELTEWENSLAVLPFEDMSPEKDQEWFCDGMTEQVISNLGRLPSLKVSARQSVMRYKDSDKTISEIGNELNVAHVLESSIRKSGNRIRVTAQLIKVAEGFHVWAQDFDRDLDDVFNIQDDISQKIAKALLNKLTDKQVAQVKTETPKNLEAYEAYIKAEYFMTKKFLSTRNMGDFKTSERLFLRAIELDQKYAEAYARLGNLYWEAYFTWEDSSGHFQELWEKYTRQSYEMNPSSAIVNVAMGNFLYEIKNDNERAFELYLKAIEINPNLSECYIWIATYLHDRGLCDYAYEYYTKAVMLDPLDVVGYTNRAFECYSCIGDFKKAEADFLKALEIDPNNVWNLSLYSEYLIRMKKFKKAKEICLRYNKITYNTRIMARLHAFNGEKEKALASLQPLLQNYYSSVSDIRYYYRETKYIYLILGMKEEAFSSLMEESREFIKIGDSFYYFLLYDPIYDDYRVEPRFQEILAKHKEIYEENLRKYGNIDI